MTAKSNDRRRAPRAPVLLSVQYETVASTEGAQTVDISRSGLFLGTKQPLPVGTQLELIIGESSRLKVRVQRVVEPDVAGNRTPGMGCLILEADDAATAALANEMAHAPAREVKVVLGGHWPAAVPLSPKHALPAYAAASATSSIKSKPAEAAHAAKGNGAPASEAKAAPQQAGADKKSKKDKKKQKGQKADLFAEKPE